MVTDSFLPVILYYDHSMTLDDEIRYIWLQRKFTGSWIFLFNRYLAFFSVRVVITRAQQLLTILHRLLLGYPGF